MSEKTFGETASDCIDGVVGNDNKKGNVVSALISLQLFHQNRRKELEAQNAELKGLLKIVALEVLNYGREYRGCSSEEIIEHFKEQSEK